MFDTFLGGYKKEFKAKKKDGLVDEKAADPISFTLDKLLLKLALEGNNVMVWFWTVVQWNFMARSASIDPLTLQNFRIGTDSIIGKYDKAKMDQAGERLSEKTFTQIHMTGQCAFGLDLVFGFPCAMKTLEAIQNFFWIKM